MENRNRETRPSQYGGAEIATSAAPIIERSNRDRGLMAEMVPTMIPLTSQITAAPSASEIVAGKRLKIIVLTGVWYW